jgi:hypothetical protein
MSKWAWGSADANQVVTITNEAVAAHHEKHAAKALRSKTSLLIRLLPVVSLFASAVAIVLLIDFFKHTPTGISGQQVMNRFAYIATSAAILAGLGLLLGMGLFLLAKNNNYDLQVSARVLGVISIILATGVFGTAVFCWTTSERAASLSTPSTSDNELVQRLNNATVVIQAHDPNINRYRSAKREGVIVATEAGRTLILTVPFLDESGNAIQPPDVWVDFSDGGTLGGRFVWAQSDPLPLAIVEVARDKSPGQVQFHPTAEAFIPGQSVLVIPNPLYGWSLQKGVILSRASRRTRIGWNTVVKTNLPLGSSDIGSAMYDESGRFLGLMIGFKPVTGESQFVIVDSATASVLSQGLRGK